MHISWFYLVLIYILTNTISKVVQRLSLQHEEVDSTAFCAFFMFTVGSISIPFLLIEDINFSVDIRALGAVFLSSILYSVSMLLFHHAMKLTEVSQVETIATTRSIWSMVIGAIFFHEVLNISKLLGIIFICLGLAVVYWQKGSFNGFKKPHFYTAAYAMLITCAYALDKYALDYFSVIMYQVIIYIIPSIFITVFLPGTFTKIKKMIKPEKTTYLILLCCCFQMISTLALYRAYQVGGELSVVGPLTQLTTVLITIIGIVFLKERWNLTRKIIGITLACIGVIFIKVLSF